MRRMKALWLTFTFLLLLFSAQKAVAQSAERQCVVVETKDGERMEYLLSDNPRIVHNDASIVLTTNSVNVEFQTANISKVYFSTTSTGISKVKVAEGKISLQQNSVILKGFGANESVTLYDSDGRQLWHQTTDGEGQFMFSLHSLPRGLYIVKTRNQSFKVTRK